MDIEPEPGLLTCVDHPAAVSGGVINVPTVLHHMMALLARMLACDPEQAGDAMVPRCEGGRNVVSGTDDQGIRFGSAFVEHVGGFGATATTTGWTRQASTTGLSSSIPTWRSRRVSIPFSSSIAVSSPTARAGTVAGRGRDAFRRYAVPLGRARMGTAVGGTAICGYGAKGVMGAYPVPTIDYRILKDTNVYELFKRHRVPTDPADLETEETVVFAGKARLSQSATAMSSPTGSPAGAATVTPFYGSPNGSARMWPTAGFR